MKKFALPLALLLPCLASAAKASKTVLPDSCGADKVTFDVATKKDQPAPARPADGKAQIVLIETFNRPSAWSGVHMSNTTTRFGIDGAWVGATKSNSYFTIDVTPGEHHLCTSVKGSKDLIGMNTFTAEAGKTYYFEYKIEPNISHGRGTAMVGGSMSSVNTTNIAISAGLNTLGDEEGKFRIKASEVSLSAPSQ